MSDSSRTVWTILGIVGGIFVLLCGICGGGIIWFASFPSVPATAQQPFDVKAIPAPATEPTVGDEQIVNGARFREVQWGNGQGIGDAPGTNSRLWIYLPEGNTAPKSLPCIFIAGAGSTLLSGMMLGEGDQDEHFPYVKAGFAVVAYDLDGGGSVGDLEIEEGDSLNVEDLSGYRAFRASQAGLVNARNALEYTLANVPEVNPKQLFSVGHSSAGTLALLFAEHEPRLAGCVAYAPAIDLKNRFPGFLVRTMGKMFPNMAEFIVQSSPRTHEDRLNCPTLIFHAADDENVPIADSRSFVKRMKAKNKDVVLEEVPTGDHYESMISQGIPKGIDFIKKHLR
jgi:dipeptidyl aminopeptidase/acylaminoacyl peptidase